eukprot:Phypoly_transcript_11239.p2 GENE.Phypoly_transcript_11239~~Phypoly_transcript_11239.p2  ORF type:complete len:101 (+),score=4.39 Phypoly_transcript_11239:522-824(+)
MPALSGTIYTQSDEYLKSYGQLMVLNQAHKNDIILRQQRPGCFSLGDWFCTDPKAHYVCGLFNNFHLGPSVHASGSVIRTNPSEELCWIVGREHFFSLIF